MSEDAPARVARIDLRLSLLKGLGDDLAATFYRVAERSTVHNSLMVPPDARLAIETARPALVYPSSSAPVPAEGARLEAMNSLAAKVPAATAMRTNTATTTSSSAEAAVTAASSDARTPTGRAERHIVPRVARLESGPLPGP